MLRNSLPIRHHAVACATTRGLLLGKILPCLLKAALLSCQLLLKDMPPITVTGSLRVFLHTGETRR